MKPNDQPAFPQYETAHGNPMLLEHGDGAAGMTLRDYFAAKAMQSCLMLMSTPEYCAKAMDAAEHAKITLIDHFANKSYEMADAMMKAREK